MADDKLTPDIPAALSPEEWVNSPRNIEAEAAALGYGAPDVARLARIIALANAAMSDEDPRKLTREHVAALRARIEAWGEESIAGYEEPGGIGVSGDNPDLEAEAREIELLGDLADVIESFLPPTE